MLMHGFQKIIGILNILLVLKVFGLPIQLHKAINFWIYEGHWHFIFRGKFTRDLALHKCRNCCKDELLDRKSLPQSRLFPNLDRSEVLWNSIFVEKNDEILILFRVVQPVF